MALVVCTVTRHPAWSAVCAYKRQLVWIGLQAGNGTVEDVQMEMSTSDGFFLCPRQSDLRLVSLQFATNIARRTLTRLYAR